MLSTPLIGASETAKQHDSELGHGAAVCIISKQNSKAQIPEWNYVFSLKQN